jgi:KaiC/GvpD/RAD55 family RecA-like ATPase
MIDPLSEYIAAPSLMEEWRIVLSLAAAPSPAQACRAMNWRRELFSDEEARVAFDQVAQAQRTCAVTLPAALDGLTPYPNDEALRQMRQRMVRAVVLMHYLPDYQANLRDRLYQMTQVRPLVGDDLDQRLKEMLDATLASMDTSLGTLRALVSPLPREVLTTMTQGELGATYWDRIEQMREALPTGFESLTTILNGGLRPERVLTVLGGPGGGKTTFCNQIAEYAANAGRPVVYVACEEPPATLYAKTLARIGRVGYAAAQFGWRAEREAIDRARALVRERESSRRLLYVEGFTDLAGLQEVVATHFQRYADEEQGGGTGVLVIDYLQVIAQALVRSGSGQVRDENQCIGLLMYELRVLAKVLNCTILVISSQSRASGYGNNNPLTSGRGSNFIEYSSDVLISLDKDEESPLSAEMRRRGFEWRKLALPKNRLGTPGGCSLLWRGHFQEFSEMETTPHRLDEEEEEE